MNEFIKLWLIIGLADTIYVAIMARDVFMQDKFNYINSMLYKLLSSPAWPYQMMLRRQQAIMIKQEEAFLKLLREKADEIFGEDEDNNKNKDGD